MAAGATQIERVDRLVQLIGDSLGMRHEAVDETVRVVTARLEDNQTRARLAEDARDVA